MDSRFVEMKFSYKMNIYEWFTEFCPKRVSLKVMVTFILQNCYYYHYFEKHDLIFYTHLHDDQRLVRSPIE